MTPEETRECRDCGLRQKVPALEHGAVARCVRCNSTLRQARHVVEGFPLLCASVAAALFFTAIFVPFMSVKAPGREAHATVFDGPIWLQEEGFLPIALLVFTTLIVMPGLKLAGLVAVLAGIRSEHPPRWVGPVFRWVKHLSPWAMVEVFLLAAFVAYTRLDALAQVFVDPALIMLGGVMLCTVAAETTLDEENVWDVVEAQRKRDAVESELPGIMCHGCGRLEHRPPGARCGRCRARLHPRKENSIERTAALLVASFLMYIPANILPVMTVKRLGHGGPNTILGGVTELVKAQLIPLAVLVFTASFVVPMLKIVGLAVMVIATERHSAWRLRARTKLYRFIDIVGRWSMLDVFVLSTLVGLVHMGFLGSVRPNWGAAAFGGVVVFTMLAAGSFDPRLMWDVTSSSPPKTP